MNELIPNYAEGTSAGKWNPGQGYQVLHASLSGGQYLTTTSDIISDLILVENDWLTGSGAIKLPSPQSESTSSIRELREVSGLTWDQLASLFDVSRRTLHFWDSGNAMAAPNQEKLGRILGAIRSFDTGNPTDNRRILLTTVEGHLPLDLLRDGRFEVLERIKKYFMHRHERTALSLTEASARSAIPIAVLAGAKQDRVHIEKRKARSVKVRRSKKA